MSSLEERVRDLIGDEGPQLPVWEHDRRIDQRLAEASPADLLRWISAALAAIIEEKLP